MKKIDSHLHINLHRLNPGNLIDYLNAGEIEKCWLLSWEELSPPIPSLYKHLSISEILSVYQHYPDRIIPFYAPDPSSKTLKEDFKRYIDAGVKGCGELKVTHQWKDEPIKTYLDIISGYKLPLIFHMELPRLHYVPTKSNSFEKYFEKLINGGFNGVSRYYISKFIEHTSISRRVQRNSIEFPGYLFDFDYLEQRIVQYPQITFIGHGPHFWNSIANKFSEKYIHQKGKYSSFGIIDRLLEEYDNFYCDISGKSGFNAFNRDIDMTRTFFHKHCKKLLYGTDNTMIDFEGFLMQLELPNEKLKRILYDNANEIIPG